MGEKARIIKKKSSTVAISVSRHSVKIEKGQLKKLLSICNNQFMLQTIEEPTRIENTLDLMFTNEISLIKMIEVNNSNHFSHNKVEVITNYKTTEHERNN